MCKRLSLPDDKEEGIIVPKHNSSRVVNSNDVWFGGTDRFFNPSAIKNTMVVVWRPIKGVFIRYLGENISVPALS